MRTKASSPVVFCLLLLAGALAALAGELPAAGAAGALGAELKPVAVAAWEKYERLTEARIGQELAKETAERPGAGVDIRRLRTVDENRKPIEASSSMIHHWKGTVLVPAARLDEVLRFVQNYDRHQEFFKEVEKSKLESREGNTFKLFYRLKRTKVLTVVYNTEHTVIYSLKDARNASSRSVATKIAELDSPGTKDEHEKTAGQDRGFLWRLNSYWRFSERSDGVLVECESISLSRGIPAGLGWLIKGYVESVPRESLMNTLVSLRDGIKKRQRSAARLRQPQTLRLQ